MREQALFIAGPVGNLEALYLPQEDAKGIALICHPNPVKGGTMQNKVVSTLQRTARDAGLTTLRFNYRGVEQSAGNHDMEQGEVDDAQAVFNWFRQQHPDMPIYLLGFSFGGFVAGALSARLEQQGIATKTLMMIAPAFYRLDMNHPFCRTAQTTVIQPEQDEVIEPKSVYAWSDQLKLPHELIKVADCSHFFHGYLADLKSLVAARL
ncbi:alpha/beta fold hydrolase [Pseudomonas sp. F1_0610]|uniref:alpha/beta hydrolase n=1 Tax=Pseudomonas sp. F1_0610 TaxID=3114284 RepID=UPI0039C1CB91